MTIFVNLVGQNVAGVLSTVSGAIGELSFQQIFFRENFRTTAKGRFYSTPLGTSESS